MITSCTVSDYCSSEITELGKPLTMTSSGLPIKIEVFPCSDSQELKVISLINKLIAIVFSFILFSFSFMCKSNMKFCHKNFLLLIASHDHWTWN